MNNSILRGFALKKIDEAGRRLSIPKVKFSSRIISALGKDIFVANSLFNWLTNTSGFYLPLPSNTFGVVTYPNGISHNLEGGTHEVPPGRYRLQYVDKQERVDFTSPITEITRDGEKITIRVVFRYRVANPVVALQFANPVETLINHIESDVREYVRMHDHTNVFSGFNNQNKNNLLDYLAQRHNQRHMLSMAFIIAGAHTYFTNTRHME